MAADPNAQAANEAAKEAAKNAAKTALRYLSCVLELPLNEVSRAIAENDLFKDFVEKFATYRAMKEALRLSRRKALLDEANMRLDCAWRRLTGDRAAAENPVYKVFTDGKPGEEIDVPVVTFVKDIPRIVGKEYITLINVIFQDAFLPGKTYCMGNADSDEVLPIGKSVYGSDQTLFKIQPDGTIGFGRLDIVFEK